MAEHPRIVVLYDRSATGASAARLLSLLRGTYPPTTVLDLGVDEDSAELAGRLMPDDTVLVLGPDPAPEHRHAAAVRVNVDGPARPGELTLSDARWERDAARLLDVLARRVGERPSPAVPVRETERRRRSGWEKLRRSLPVIAVGTTALVVAAVALAALRTGSSRHVVSTRTSTSTTSTTSTTTSSTSTTTQTPPPADALAALSSHWRAIGRHDFAAAYALLAPGAVPQTEAQWISNEQSAGIQAVHFDGQAISTNGHEATVRVVTLITHDVRFGCRSWTGSYRMIRAGGEWLIARAGIAPRPCSPG